MSWDWHITPIGIARFLSPLIVLMGRHQEKAIGAQFKESLEAQGPD